MTRKQRRLSLIGSAMAVLAIAVGLVLYALSDTIAFFASPTDIVEKGLQPGQRLRLGGMVEAGSLVHAGPSAITFRVTDNHKAVPVSYDGIVPDLFREGQGVVAEGVLDTAGVFRADTVLAKHDEKYMPREVVDALKAQGKWGEGGPQAAAQ